MALIYVTGVSGVGKSEVCKELSRRGYVAFGSDEVGLSAWYENSSGKQAAFLPREIWKTKEWQARHSWRMSRERLAQIKDEVGETIAFVCGGASNENEVWDLFAQVICLCLDDETELRRRIEERTENDFGKEPHELEAVLGWNCTSKQTYKGLGATIVDSGQALDDVVAEVLAAVGVEHFDRG